MKKKGCMAVMMALVMAASVSQVSFAWSFGGKKEEAKGYEYVSGETRVVMNQDAAPVIAGLGKPTDVFEQPSCAYQGNDRVYYYADVDVTTYTENKKEKVASVYLKTDQVQTEEGLKVGGTYDEMVKVYGKDYKEINQIYTYKKNGTELSFEMTNQKISAIEYRMAD